MSHQRQPSLTQPQARAASRTRSRSPISRPTTPLRPSSRTSFRASTTADSSSQHHDSYSTTPLDALEPQFAELADSMADLEANFMHLQLMHESLARFGESFAAFLYGLNMNAFVVDFPEAPVVESVKRWQKRERRARAEGVLGDDENTTWGVGGSRGVGDETTMNTGDTSYASMKATPRRKSMAPPGINTPGTAASASTSGSGATGSVGGGRTGIPAARGRGGRGVGRGGNTSGLPRGRGRGLQ